MFQIYILIVNTLSFLLFALDKYKARRNLWRIPEKTLFLSAILGGSIGALAGMYLFRHKTKHKIFTFGIPVIFTLQLLVYIVTM